MTMGADTTTTDGITTAVDSEHALDNGNVNNKEGTFFSIYPQKKQNIKTTFFFVSVRYYWCCGVWSHPTKLIIQ